MITSETLLLVNAHVASGGIDDELVILNLRSGRYHALDNVGVRVWELINDSKSVGEIEAAITAEYEVEPARCRQDLLALVQQLLDSGLVEVDYGTGE